MSNMDRVLTQTLTQWVKTSYTQYADPVFDEPIEIAGRYEQRTEQFVLQSGDQGQSRAIVYTTTLVSIGDYLYLGYSEATDPETVTDADQVRRVELVPDKNARVFLYKIFL